MIRQNLAKATPMPLPFTAELLFELTPPCHLEEVPCLDRDLFCRIIARKAKERYLEVFQTRYPQFKALKATLQRSLGVAVLPQGPTRLHRILLDLTRLQSTLNPEYFTATCEALKRSLQQKPLFAEIGDEKRQLMFF